MIYWLEILYPYIRLLSSTPSSSLTRTLEVKRVTKVVDTINTFRSAKFKFFRLCEQKMDSSKHLANIFFFFWTSSFVRVNSSIQVCNKCLF